jgi:hypothetical protein
MPDLDFCKIIGRFALTVSDGVDADDNPDTVYCDEGVVKFTPITTFTKVAGASPVPMTLGNAVIEAAIDSSGYLSRNGVRYVNLVDLGSDKVNPTIPAGKATYKVTFEGVRASGTKVDFPSFDFRPTSGVDNDLTLLAPVPVAGGTAIVVGPRGASVNGASITGPGHLQLALTDGTSVDAGALPVGPGGSDGGVASYVTTPGSATETALAAKIATALTAGDFATATALASGLAGKAAATDLTTEVGRATTAEAALQDAVNGLTVSGTLTVGGLWSSGTAYAARTLVTYSGGVYVSNAATNAGDTPGVSSKWTAFPAFLTYGSDLGTADLNTFTSPGFYSQATAANATLASNYPLASEPGILIVTSPGSEMRVQQFIPSWGNSQARVIWQRSRTTVATGWGPWNAFAARRVTSALGKIETWDDVQKRWQLDATSDTGWRSLAADFLNGWTGTAHIRRRGYEVSLRLRNLAGGTAATLCAVPAGFGTNQSGTAQRALQTSSPAWPATVSISGSIVLSTGLVIPDTFQEVRWETTLAWPTTLPGAALGTIPNA